jgi:hypothetical protein
VPKKKSKTKTKKGKKRVTAAQLRERIRRRVPSEAWADSVVRGEPFPPEPTSTPMKKCVCCGTLVPFYYVNQKGICLDCHYAQLPVEVCEQMPSSNSQALLGR